MVMSTIPDQIVLTAEQRLRLARLADENARRNDILTVALVGLFAVLVVVALVVL